MKCGTSLKKIKHRLSELVGEIYNYTVQQLQGRVREALRSMSQKTYYRSSLLVFLYFTEPSLFFDEHDCKYDRIRMEVISNSQAPTRCGVNKSGNQSVVAIP